VLRRVLIATGLLLYGGAVAIGFIFISLVLIYLLEQIWMILL